MKVLFVSPVSATIELDNNEIYYSKEEYNVFLNNEIVLKNVRKNVFSLFELEPDTMYSVKVNDKCVSFKTKSVTEIINVNENSGSAIQNIIDNSKEGSLICFNEGTYNIVSLSLKKNRTYYLKKGSTILASSNPDDYEIIDEYQYSDDKKLLRGTWEGLLSKQKKSIIDIFNQENVDIVGEGTIDGNASNSIWWTKLKRTEIARPHLIFIEESKNINIQGIFIINSPQWTIHPFYSDYLGFYDLRILNPKISPNTDGLDPQSSTNVNIIGVEFSVGDDCIAIKSGKLDLSRKHFKRSEYITIRNCLMRDGHGAVVLGSEMSSGIAHLNISRCLFINTDRGLRIKTRRGRGDKAVVDHCEISDIKMENVLTPLTMNMFYFCDPDGKTPYVYTKDKLDIDDRTPYLGHFSFKNINAIESEFAAGVFYGLPEMPIEEIKISNSSFSFKKDASKGESLMMTDAKEYKKSGFEFYNVKNVILENVKLEGVDGENITRFNNPNLIIK